MTADKYTRRMGGNNDQTSRDLVPGFAGMISTAREGKGWTRQDLATAAGISPNTVSAIEREVRAPSLRVASALVAALGLVVMLHDPARPLGPK